MHELSLRTPIEYLPRAKKVASAMKRLGIHTVRDLLFYFPSRYEDFSNVKPIAALAEGEVVTVRGKITRITNRRTVKRRMMLTEARVHDETGSIAVVWFNQPYLVRNIQTDEVAILSGKVARGARGLYLQSPAYERGNKALAIHTGRLVPVYPETEGVTSRWIRFLISSVIHLRKAIDDPLPRETVARFNFPRIADAVFSIHFPHTKQRAAAAKQRFIFTELLLFHLRALRERAKLKRHPAPEIPLRIELIKEFVASLPFSLTDAQRRSLWEIAQDLTRPHPMNRLLEGDVGSGKTVVAAAASLVTVRAGYRVAVMAPTEILAHQHLETFKKTLEPFEVSIGLATATAKKNINADIVIGTHALIQKHVALNRLGLVIIDEQHRFGVEQRAMLTKKQTVIPHFLSMSATPIPRTLALTIYGDLDLSIIDEMPKSRRPVTTKVINPEEREAVYQFIRDEVKRGRQAFIICPRIETLDGNTKTKKFEQQKLLTADTKTVKEEYKRLSERVFRDLRVGMLHGKMKSKEKDEIMKKFRDREIDILVSTSVIEVGVDIPNATVMVIEGAERFGLAQLHQFRGRVGRGAEQSYCFLFQTEDGAETRRLRAMCDAKNGFELAEYDLKIRGPGTLFGTRQSGIPDIALEGITDATIVRSVQKEAAELVKISPDLARYPALLAALNRMEQEVHLE